MLARLGIRQKLSLLLTVPLAAVVLVLVPFTAERIDDARSAATTARTAKVAREVGALIQTLQQERLLALGYLSAPSLDRSALLAQSQTAVDETARLRADPETAEVMAAAGPAIDALEGFRKGTIARTIPARTAYFAYRDANTSLIDALRLTNPPGADAQGVTQLVALDALMRSSEEASSVGAILVAAAADRRVSRTLLTDAVTADRQHLRRFRDLVPADQVALIDSVNNGQAGQRIRTMIDLVNSAAPITSAQVSQALTAAVSYTGLRRLAQDRSAREIATAAQSRARTAQTTALVVGIGALLLFACVVWLGVTVSRSIARPLRRLTRAAAVVAELSRSELVRVADSDSPDPAPPRLAAVDVNSADEIGELAAAINQVQTTAAQMIERQVSARRNIATMFTNIARRTQSLAARQLALLDELERNEHQPDLLRRLYRLDHVATRLRRNADSLLVVSGTIDPVLSGGPTPLVDVIRLALAEIEGYRAVQLGLVGDITVNANLVGDLRLLLAELLDNAANFSPPSVPVEVSATLMSSSLVSGTECHITIVDHGVGLSPGRLAEENRRLVERERLDVAPTTVLGLFVVGRLARRHGLAVRLEHSDGRGVTATVVIPHRLLGVAGAGISGVGSLAAIGGGRAASVGRPRPIRGPLDVDVGDNTAREPFPWFTPPPNRMVAISASPEPVAARGVASVLRPVPPYPAEAALGPSAGPGTGPSMGPATGHEMEPATGHGMEPAMGSTFSSFGSTFVPGAPVPGRGAPVPGRGAPVTGRANPDDLARRVPGQHLDPGGLDPSSPATGGLAAGGLVDDEPTLSWVPRDPDAERDKLNDYLSGLSRGDGGERPQ